ncbi:ATP-dependent DNA helicase PIF1-like [Artemia franciscana]|uniref:ATP-dependent DNA helicase PIF1-like n=1 Tax=Artemia franciscana TaxID=6661 RepID=UPI0032DAE63B
MPKNVDCRSVNETLLAKTSDNISTFTAIDRLSTVLRDKRIEAEAAENVKSFENDSKRTAGSISHLKLALGTRVMLQRNINVEEGLVNGSMGYVKGFKMTAANRAVGIQVQFDRQDKIVEIERETLKFEALKEVYYTRRQFPLTLAYAITIHKSQGLSLQTALVDAGDRCFGPGMIYLALSRVTMSEGLHLIDLDRRKSCADTEALVEYNRLRQKYRPDVPQFGADFYGFYP